MYFILQNKKILAIKITLSLLVSCLVSSGLMSSQFMANKVWASPASNVIDFEDRSDRELIFNQYANLGVIFHGSSVRAFSQLPGFAHSGAKAVQPCPFATEFCIAPITLSFTAPQNHVKVWFGLEFPFNEQKMVVLRAFNSSGMQVGESSHSVPASTNPTPVSIPLEVTTQNANITSVIVTIDNAATCLCTAGLTIDDIEFDSAGPPPVCPTTDNPVLVLDHPANGVSSHFNSFLLEGTVTTNAPIDYANVTALKYWTDHYC